MRFGDVCRDVEAGRPVPVPDGFTSAVRSAIGNARRNREIGLFQYWRLLAALNNPRQVQRIYAGVIDEAIACGAIGADASADGFDWNAILAFIERLIPLILQLISLFS